jgi:Ca-activated chloride channel family protein
MSHRFCYLALLLLFSVGGMSQSTHDLLLAGDDVYKKEQYDLAEELYRKAKAKDKSGKASYNLGNSLSVLERYEEAANQYSSAAAMSNDPEVKSKALYNLGNTHFRNQKFKESVDAYKSALSVNQDDQQTKENLMMAKRMLRVQEQQQQQQQQQDQDQQDQQDQKEQEEQQQQDQSQDQNKSQEEKEQPQSGEESEKKDLDKEDARKLLEIIDNEEKKVQEKLRKMKGNSTKPKKDW